MVRAIIRYGIIGLGHIAQAAMLPAFAHARRNSRLVALVSGSERKLKELGRRYGVKRLCRYEDAAQLFNSGEIDAVYIALPNDQHKEWAIRAARAGLHVLCEKPMAVTTKDCEQMIQAAKAARAKLMIAYRLHFERATLQAIKIARSGQLGDLRFFSSDFSMQVSQENIRLRRQHGGGPLFDIGVYCINAARYCLGDEPTAVWATATKSRDKRFREIDETVVGALRFGDERLASFTCSFGGADRSTFTLTGTKGSLTLDPAYEYAEGLSQVVRRGPRERHRDFAKRDQFAAELEYFSDCIVKGRDPEPSGKEGLIDVRIVEGMMKSIRTGRWVPVAGPERQHRPSMKQERRRPPVPREPNLIDVKAAAQ